MKTITIAAAANLDKAKSVHSATFQSAVLFAVELAQRQHHVNVELFWVNDAATPEGGLKAAQIIVGSEAKAVVGHFASGAAFAAAPIYEAAKLPLLLPAATAHGLTQFRGVYRLCDPDSEYCMWVAKWISARPIRKICISTDGSTHGESVRRELSAALHPDCLCESPANADALLFSGMFDASVAFVRERLDVGEQRWILLTDDAQSNRLATGLLSGVSNVLIMGFRTSAPTAAGKQIAEDYAERHGEQPGIYFFETVAAMQVAAAWLCDGVQHVPVQTVLGRVMFGDDGESYPRRFACFAVADGRLVEMDNGAYAHG